MKGEKKFKDTAFGKFIDKAKDIAPELLTVAGRIATGNLIGAVEEAGNILKSKSISNEKAKLLLNEFKQFEMTFQKECLELEVIDRDSARNREVKVKESGSFDLMMSLTVLTGLCSFIFIIYAIVFIPSVKKNDLFVHLMGMVEGVVIGNIFAYYLGGSSNNKKERT